MRMSARAPINAFQNQGIYDTGTGRCFMRTLRLYNHILAAFIALTLAFASGCGKGTQSGAYSGLGKSGSRTARGFKPYTIDGTTYYPLTSAQGFREEGIASWYGPDFHGKTTANGEEYDMYDMTAAHKLLPFDTKVRVTNLTNGKSIVVRINDRGPFIDKRVIDLSKTGADRLGMLGCGTARVRVEAIGAPPACPSPLPAPQQNPRQATPPSFYVQVGSFSQKPNAQAMAKQISGNGLASRIYYANEARVWRVQAGPFSSLTQAERAKSLLRGASSGMVVFAE